MQKQNHEHSSRRSDTTASWYSNGDQIRRPGNAVYENNSSNLPSAPRFGNLKYPFISPEIGTERYQPPQTDQTIQTVQMALAFHTI